MVVANFGNTVKVHYTVKLEDGTIVDNTRSQEPFVFTLGMGQVIPGFERAVIGMSTGTSKTVKVDVEEAYGQYYKEFITEVSLDEFPADFKFEANQRYEIPRGDGQLDLVTVLQVTDKTVIFDKNHPLAGKNLTIDLELLEIM